MRETQAARTEATRTRLLEAAFGEVHRRGFRAASVDDIAAAAGITKGALFHHFEGKQALGYAMVDEVLASALDYRWLAPLASSDDPVLALQDSFRGRIAEDTASGLYQFGCPMNNLAQEMSPSDEGFRIRLDAMYALWRQTISAAIRRGQHARHVRDDVDPQAAATLIVVAQMGIWGTGKCSQDKQLMIDAGQALCAYLESLRPLEGHSPDESRTPKLMRGAA